MISEPVPIATLLRDISTRLEAVSDSPRLDAEILLGRAIDMPRSYLFAHPDDTPDPAAVERLESSVARRLSGEPMAYITGTREFWSLDLLVSPATLVPRPETEILVERALREIPREADWQILDLGTGSGAIAVAIGRDRPSCRVTAVDLSPAALRIAEQNVRQLDLDNVTCLEGSWTDPVRGRIFDLVVSNPPYVPENHPDLDLLRAEPQGALAAGADGLDALRTLAHDVLDVLADGGMLLLEHGDTQDVELATLLDAHGWTEIECHRDYAGLPRVTSARKPAANAPGAEL